MSSSCQIRHTRRRSDERRAASVDTLPLAPGVDFSARAIAVARRLNPVFLFVVADLMRSHVFAEEHHDSLVCLEVLEHIQGDLGLVSQIPPGTRCLCHGSEIPLY